MCPTDAAHTADNRCCCKRLLGAQPDFAAEPTPLERTIAELGHRSLFLPKFHCELNWIERYWGAAKKYARKHCAYTLVALRTMIPIALSQSPDEVPEELRSSPDLPVVPLFKQRRHARISLQYCSEYLKGESRGRSRTPPRQFSRHSGEEVDAE